jgi:uncharacterized protein YidB (DUF937 family)
MHKKLEVSLTENSWLGIQSLSERTGLSISELLEQLGSGELVLVNPEQLEDALDLQEALTTLAKAEATGEKPMAWEEFEAELEEK